ncbi:MAG: hypothetical protein HY650_11730 [Acidobacteria bacterium]|nr:hypothetical protein [Acidobacteriota bacterium]
MSRRISNWGGRLGMILAGLASLALASGVNSRVPLESVMAGPALEPIVVSGACEIGQVVDRYRSLLGPDNGGIPGSRGSGRREIDWDSVPDDMAAPVFLPPAFFNVFLPPRARGAILSTPGQGVQVSARRDNPGGIPVRFGHINSTYPAIFKTFSEERLFSPIGSNVVDLRFFVPGTSTPALSRGFGAVYTDVDQDETSFEYFDAGGTSLGRFRVPQSNTGLSFLGVIFEAPIVARVRIEYGTAALGLDDSLEHDVAVMDNFIYGEPQAIGAMVSR